MESLLFPTAVTVGALRTGVLGDLRRFPELEFCRQIFVRWQ